MPTLNNKYISENLWVTHSDRWDYYNTWLKLATFHLKYYVPLVSNTQEPLREEIIKTKTMLSIPLQRNMDITRFTKRVKGFIITFYGGI